MSEKVSTAQIKPAAKQNRVLFGPLGFCQATERAILVRVCSAACLHLSVCLWVTSLKRYWFNPFLCKSSDLREHGGRTFAACPRQRRVFQSCAALYLPLWEVLKPLLTRPGLVYVCKWLFCSLRWKKRMKESSYICSLPPKRTGDYWES